MKYILHKKKELSEDYVEIHYKKMTTHIERIVECIKDLYYIQGIIEGEKYKIAIQNIYYFETVDKVCFAYMAQDVYRVAYTLQEAETHMHQYGFVRISKSVVVNVFQVVQIKSDANMRMKVKLENEEVLLVSRRYKKHFENRLQSVYEQVKGYSE